MSHVDADPTQTLARLGIDEGASFAAQLERLTQLSRERHENPFVDLVWPDSLPDDAWWLSPELLTVHGTEQADELSEAQRKQLSKWECINLFSLNVEGERELINLLALRLYAPDRPGIDTYLHHFIDEENKHLWMFGEFCRRYGGKIYSSKQMGIASERFAGEMEIFLLFARTFIFEEIGNYYHAVAGADQRVSAFVRSIHRMHHADESRHVAFGRAVLAHSKDAAFAVSSEAERRAAVAHLQRFVQISVESLYQPAMYRDIGILGGVALRRKLLSHPARRARHETIMRRPLKFLASIGIQLEASPS